MMDRRTIKNRIKNDFKKIIKIRGMSDEEILIFLKKEVEFLSCCMEDEVFNVKITKFFKNLMRDKWETEDISRLVEVVNKFDINSNSPDLLIQMFFVKEKKYLVKLKNYICATEQLGIKEDIFEILLKAVSYEYGKKELDFYGRPISEILDIYNLDFKLGKTCRDIACVEQKILAFKLVSAFTEMSYSYIYNEESLNNYLGLKRKYNGLATYFNVFDNFELMCREKLKKYYSKNVTELEIEKANVKYNFNINLVNNVIFIKSFIDNWYLIVDKVNRESILYHNNNVGVDKFHIQRVYKHNNIEKILNAIHKHDLYSLNRFS